MEQLCNDSPSNCHSSSKLNSSGSKIWCRWVADLINYRVANCCAEKRRGRHAFRTTVTASRNPPTPFLPTIFLGVQWIRIGKSAGLRVRPFGGLWWLRLLCCHLRAVLRQQKTRRHHFKQQPDVCQVLFRRFGAKARLCRFAHYRFTKTSVSRIFLLNTLSLNEQRIL